MNSPNEKVKEAYQKETELKLKKLRSPPALLFPFQRLSRQMLPSIREIRVARY